MYTSQLLSILFKPSIFTSMFVEFTLLWVSSDPKSRVLWVHSNCVLPIRIPNLSRKYIDTKPDIHAYDSTKMYNSGPLYLRPCLLNLLMLCFHIFTTTCVLRLA